MHKFEWGPYNCEYPEKWNELNADQLLFISSLLQSEMKRETFETLLLQNFIDVPWIVFCRINPNELAEVVKTLSFIFDTKELTRNLFPEISFRTDKKLIRFYGPADGLTDCTFEQFFGYSETYFNMFAEKGDEESLNLFVACLYSRNKGGKFCPDDIEINLPLIRQVSGAHKYAIVLFYLGCRDFIAFKFPELFSGESKNIERSDLHFFTLVDNLNNEDITKNEHIKQSNLYEAFVRLVQMIKKAEHQNHNS